MPKGAGKSPSIDFATKPRRQVGHNACLVSSPLRGRQSACAQVRQAMYLRKGPRSTPLAESASGAAAALCSKPSANNLSNSEERSENSFQLL